MTTIVSATFKTRPAAESAIYALEARGFTENDLSVVMTEQARGRGFKIREASKVPEGAAIGGVAGGILGALAAGLVAVGSVAAPGIGLLVAGPLVAALAGGGAGAAAGGLVGGLIGLGLPEHEAKLYEKEVTEGAVLVAVRCETSERAKEAKDVFEHQDAQHIAA